MKFIITDPCYIMNEHQYDMIYEKQNCNFEGQKFPLFSTHREYTSTEIFFHKIAGTPNGDGSYDYRGQHIGVDAGMLCIAERSTGVWNEHLGATFETLAEAERAFPEIIKHF